jgi:outer membrane translocation and assembly module TamA
MPTRIRLAFLTVCAFAPYAFATPVHAQLSDRLNRCLPNPTFAKEVSAQRGELQRPVIFDTITFAPDSSGLSAADRQSITEALHQATIKATPDWLDEARDVVSSYLKDRGYFKANASVISQPSKTDPAGDHVALTVKIDAGVQYRAGDVVFRSSDSAQPLAFPDSQLKSLYYLKNGDVFAASAIRKSLGAVRELYGSHGYIDVVATPIAEINESTHKIDVTMEIDQGKPFRVGNVTVDTANEKARTAILAALPPGATFDTSAVSKALSDNAALLPADVSMEDVEFGRHVADGTVNLTFHLRSCPSTQD